MKRLALTLGVLLTGASFALACDQKPQNSESPPKTEASTPEAAPAPETQAQSGAQGNQPRFRKIGFPAAGTWRGVLEHQNLGGKLSGIVVEDGRVAFSSPDGTLLWGHLTATPSGDVGGSVRLFSDKKWGPELGVTGTVAPRKTLNGTLTAADNGDAEKPSFSMMTTSAYANAPYLPSLEGAWLAGETRFEFSADGQISGSLPDGCKLTGKATQHDPELSSYDFNVQISDCERAGKLEGLLEILNLLAPHDTIHYIVVSDSDALAARMFRAGSNVAKQAAAQAAKAKAKSAK